MIDYRTFKKLSLWLLVVVFGLITWVLALQVGPAPSDSFLEAFYAICTVFSLVATLGTLVTALVSYYGN